MERALVDSLELEEDGELKESESDTASGFVSASASASASGDEEDLLKRKRRPRRRAAPLRNGPLLCLVCGDTALGCVRELLYFALFVQLIMRSFIVP